MRYSYRQLCGLLLHACRCTMLVPRSPRPLTVLATRCRPDIAVPQSPLLAPRLLIRPARTMAPRSDILRSRAWPPPEPSSSCPAAARTAASPRALTGGTTGGGEQSTQREGGRAKYREQSVQVAHSAMHEQLWPTWHRHWPFERQGTVSAGRHCVADLPSQSDRLPASAEWRLNCRGSGRVRGTQFTLESKASPRRGWALCGPARQGQRQRRIGCCGGGGDCWRGVEQQ